jgi:hypothetical protein
VLGEIQARAIRQFGSYRSGTERLSGPSILAWIWPEAAHPARWHAMARSKSTFKQRDITRAIKAARAAGVADPRIEIVDGKIIIITDQTTKADANLFELEAARLRKLQGDAA